MSKRTNTGIRASNENDEINIQDYIGNKTRKIILLELKRERHLKIVRFRRKLLNQRIREYESRYPKSKNSYG